MRKHNSARIMSVLAVLILSTACSTTEDITVVASDDTPAPTDSTAAPGGDTSSDDTPAPTDSTAAPGGDTPTPGDTASPSDSPPDPATPTTEPATSEPSPESVSTGSDRIIIEYPDALLTNLSDRSTPLGRLCWALWEFGRMSAIEFFNTLAASSQAIVIVDSDASGTAPDVNDILENGDNPIGLVGIANEEAEEPTLETNSYGFLDALDAIQEPQITGVTDDPGLSEELQIFAKALFEMIAAIEEQAKVVGYRDIDYSQLPYKDVDSLPNADILAQTVTENPTKCPRPSDEDIEEWGDRINEINNVND